MSFSEKHLEAFNEDGWLEYQLETRVIHPMMREELETEIRGIVENCGSVKEARVYVADPEDPDSTLIKARFLLKAREVSASQKLSQELVNLDGVIQAFVSPA